MTATIQPSAFSGWNSPDEILIPARELAGGQILLDPCSNSFSRVNARYSLTKRDDGLHTDWDAFLRKRKQSSGLIYVNPPFDCDTLTEVAEKVDTSCRSFDRLLLAPTKSDQEWFQDTLERASAICFIKGRVKFGRKGKWNAAAAFACILAYWGSRPATFKRLFTPLGKCLVL